MSRTARLVLVGLAAGLLLVGAGLGYVRWSLGGDPGPGDPVEVEVTPGATAASIGELLAERGVIRSALAFRLVARSRGLDARLLAGTYRFETGMSVDEAIAVLLAGPEGPETYWVTIPEGLTVAQTLERIAAAGGPSVAELREVLDRGLVRVPGWVPDPQQAGPEVREPYEGLLFPETYEFRRDATAAEVLQRLVDQLDRVFSALPAGELAAAEAAGFHRYQVLIAASLIERETRVDDERPLVAAVIRNRLAIGMPLQIDATCLYAIGAHRERVLAADCEVESPYNTYLNPGLPPTPISGAGRASIRAFLTPAEVDYLYYVLDPDCSGRHRFARTLAEHQRNVAAFRASRCAP